MKNFPLVVITMLTLGVLANTVSATILIDFSRDDYGVPYWDYYGHSDPRLEGWTQVHSKGGTTNLLDTDGNPAGTLSEATNAGHWIGDNGTQNGPNIVGNIGIPAATSRIGRYLPEGVSQTLGFSGLEASQEYAV